MKTQIIQLEAHDDAISVRDKMGWSQAGRVVLVWPTRGRLLNHRLDLVLILRHSQSLGVQIALVTKDPEVRFQARSLGIPIYKTVRQAQAARWRRPATRKDSSRQLQQDRIDRASSIDQILSDPLHRKRDSEGCRPLQKEGDQGRQAALRGELQDEGFDLLLRPEDPQGARSRNRRAARRRPDLRTRAHDRLWIHQP